jgi:hypothetical protein
MRAISFGVSVLAATLAALPCQEPDGPRDPVTLGEAQAAVAAWLDRTESGDDARRKAVDLLLQCEGGLAWFGSVLHQPRGDASDPVARAAAERRDQFATHVVLGFVHEIKASGFVFRGQFEPLSVLEPEASTILLRLLLDAPGWFDMGMREQLVPALRDLMPEPPSVPQLLGAVKLVEDRRREPDSLRLQLECLLSQWGRQEYIEERISRLRRESGEGDAEDRLLSFRALADVYYRLGDYKRAGKTQDVLLRMSETAGVPVTPTDWYWAACFRSLQGDVERGMQALQQCAVMQADRYVDRSLKLPRKLFEGDPEIAVLREDPRFGGILEQAFPELEDR